MNDMEGKISAKPIVTIGLPVYNGEKFLQKKLESISNQTLKNFQVLISDNASDDQTSKICKEFMKTDNRIQYFKQEKNIGNARNFYFVLDQTATKYFVWSAVDDFMHTNFLKKNIENLEKNENYVGSVSKIEYFDDNGLIKKKSTSYEKIDINSSYDKRASYYLRVVSAENIYAIFRTNALQQSKVKDMIAVDGAILLKVLKFGDIFVTDEVLLTRYILGMSAASKDLIERIHKFNTNGITGKVIPYLPYTKWCIQNVGILFFLKNIDYFLKINIQMEYGLLKSGIKRIIKNK